MGHRSAQQYRRRAEAANSRAKSRAIRYAVRQFCPGPEYCLRPEDPKSPRE
jgi:hypothetical protein